MKTQIKKSVLVSSTVFILSVILILSACTGKQEKTGVENTGEAEGAVKAPTMDIHTATILGDLDVIKQHIAAGSDLDMKEPTVGSSPLISAAVFDKREVA